MILLYKKRFSCTTTPVLPRSSTVTHRFSCLLLQKPSGNLNLSTTVPYIKEFMDPPDPPALTPLNETETRVKGKQGDHLIPRCEGIAT
jgi:hypothetical protein